MYPENENSEDELIERTREIWGSRFGYDVSRDDAHQIIANIAGFFSVLAEWTRTERPTPANDNGELRLSREIGRVTPIVESVEGKSSKPSEGPTTTSDGGIGPSPVACSGSVGNNNPLPRAADRRKSGDY